MYSVPVECYYLVSARVASSNVGYSDMNIHLVRNVEPQGYQSWAVVRLVSIAFRSDAGACSI